METTLSQTSAPGGDIGTIAATPLSTAIGAEIVGVDLRAPLDDARFEWILKAWHRHCVLLFRDQRLENEDQLRFAGRFGELSKIINKHSTISGHPSVMLVSNIRQDGQLIGALPDGEM
jgi:taurine dioxygenase